MPWGCVGQSSLGSSGPGTGGCGLPGTFTKLLGIVPGILSTFKSIPKKPEVPR